MRRGRREKRGGEGGEEEERRNDSVIKGIQILQKLLYLSQYFPKRYLLLSKSFKIQLGQKCQRYAKGHKYLTTVRKLNTKHTTKDINHDLHPFITRRS